MMWRPEDKWQMIDGDGESLAERFGVGSGYLDPCFGIFFGKVRSVEDYDFEEVNHEGDFPVAHGEAVSGWVTVNDSKEIIWARVPPRAGHQRIPYWTDESKAEISALRLKRQYTEAGLETPELYIVMCGWSCWRPV